jgi:hypothetical protein
VQNFENGQQSSKQEIETKMLSDWKKKLFCSIGLVPGSSKVKPGNLHQPFSVLIGLKKFPFFRDL